MSCSNSFKLLFEVQNPTYCMGVFEDLVNGDINLSTIIVYADVNDSRGDCSQQSFRGGIN